MEDPRRKQGSAPRQVRKPGSGVRRAGSVYEPRSRQGGGSLGRAGQAPAGQRQVYRAPAPPPGAYREMHEHDGAQPRPAPSQMSRRPAPPENPRERARRQRQLHRRNRCILAASTAAGVLLLAALLNLILPSGSAAPDAATPESAAGMTASVIAPLPYAGIGGAAEQEAALNWGAVGPARQTGGYTYAAAPQASPKLEAFGEVERSWFADAAFLGDSLTEGFTEYGIDVGGALVCGYVGASPNQIVNRAELDHPERGMEVPLDVLAQAQPKKLYILIGTNALQQDGSYDGFLAYYGRMLDELRGALPQTDFYVQSILPVRPEALERSPGLASGRLGEVNAALLELCREKGCYYLDLWEAFADAEGNLSAEYAESDGIHLLKKSYTTWLNYLCSHTPYAKENPYRPGSEYYLTDALKALLSDLN